ncbi:era-like GTP-binding protein [Scleroderma citrinum]
MNPHFDRIGHFRVLVIGRSNAGKTTLLQRVCNSIELPEVTNSKGGKVVYLVPQYFHDLVHYPMWSTTRKGHVNIEDEIIFQSNPGFIFHDSRGFEAGSEDEVKLMKKFVAERAAALILEQRIHVIWYCIPLTDYDRPIMPAEELFFNECNIANVPVIVVLTKADAMELVAIGQLRDEGLAMKEAKLRAGELTTEILNKLKTRIEAQLAGFKYPPKDCVSLSKMNKDQADCNPLLRCTVDALDEKELQKLVMSTQRINFVLNIEFTISFMMKAVHSFSYNKGYLELDTVGCMPYTKVR